MDTRYIEDEKYWPDVDDDDPVCEMCLVAGGDAAVKIQTIPGSLDMKFATMYMCRDCRNEYKELLAGAWGKK